VGAVAVGAAPTLQIQARVDSPDPVINTATVRHSDQFEPHPPDNSSGATTTPRVADLAIAKTVSNPHPNVGDTITFVVTLTNNGPVDDTGVEVTDPLPPGFTLVTSTPSQGSYHPATGVWTVGALANGATVTLRLTARVASPLAQINTATITHADAFDPDPSNNSAGALVAPGRADLALTKSVKPTQVFLGFNVTYSVTVHNNGINAATNVFVDDPLPAGLVFVSSTPSQGAFRPASGIWMVGTLAPGATAVLKVTARVAAVGRLVNRAVTGADQFDPNLANNVAAAAVRGLIPPALVSKRNFLASARAAAGAPPLPALALLRSDVLFVESLYLIKRGRPALPGELASWVNLLLLGVLSRADVARRI
jgi:uncharacterized repeat protein (TIGR01451 family)